MEKQFEDIFEKIKGDRKKMIEESIDPEYVYTCNVPHCRHQPCIETPEYPPTPHIVSATVERYYKEQVGEQYIGTFNSRMLRHYEFDNPKKFTDSEERLIGVELEGGL